MKTVVLGTLNRGKLREIAAIFEGLPVNLVNASDMGIQALPEENGESFLDNALLKAAFVYQKSGFWSLADDSGLEVLALGGAPGVFSSRFGGVEHDDRRNIERLLKEMEGISDRRAKFVCTAVLVVPSAQLDRCKNLEEATIVTEHKLLPHGTKAIVALGEVWGEIAREPRGENGFGYDPVFYRADLGHTFAELSRDEKNALSHRGQAFRQMKRLLEGLLEVP